MKKNLIFLSAVILIICGVFSTSCDKDDNNPPVVQTSLIKKITADYIGDGTEVEGWEFIYNAAKKVTSIINTFNGAVVDTILYDYAVPGRLTITKSGNPTVYVLDGSGRVIKELWNVDGTEWEGYEYDADGIMTKIIEHYGGADHLKYDLTIANKNITNRIRYEEDGTVREDREFTYTTGDNTNGIHQIYAVDSEWKHVGGTFGNQSKKLMDAFVRHITSDPLTAYGVDYVYTFDSENRVATVTKNGTSSGGTYTEIYTYSYY